MKMEKIMLEDYIILCIENKKVRIIYDAGNTDLYLWKYGSFYLSRDWLSIIPNCPKENIATVYKGNIIKNLIMDCQSYTKYRPNETTGGIFVSWRRKEELPTGA